MQSTVSTLGKIHLFLSKSFGILNISFLGYLTKKYVSAGISVVIDVVISSEKVWGLSVSPIKSVVENPDTC